VLDGAVAYSRGCFPEPDGMVIPGRGKDYAGHFVCVVVVVVLDLLFFSSSSDVASLVQRYC